MALGDLSFAFFLAPLANQPWPSSTQPQPQPQPTSHPANELAGYGCTVLTALNEMLPQYRQQFS